MSSLFISLKDFNNENLLHFFAKSQIKHLKAEAEKEGIELDTVEVTDGDRYSSKILTSLWLCDTMATDVAIELKKAVQCFTGLLPIKLVDLTSAGENSFSFL